LKKILLFGCGGNAKIAIEILSKDYKIISFIDNAPHVQGGKINGINIVSPQKIKALDFDHIFITSMYVPEITEQLLQLGVKNKQIKVFNKNSHKQLKAICFSLVYPIYGFLPNMLRMLNTIYNSGVLLTRKFSNYNRYTAAHGINSLFYWTQALNFERFGRNGVSDFVSTGNYSLGNWWFSSLPSLYLYKRLGSLLPVASMFIWFFSHFLWFGNENTEIIWTISILTIIFFSSYFFGACFVFLNYNAVGWMFMPLGLYGLINENFWIAAFAWSLTSFASITVVFIVFWISLAYSTYNSTAYPLLSITPSLLIICINFLYSKNIKSSILKTAAAIGLNNFRNRKTKYKRSTSKCFVSKSFLYFLIVWGSFACILWTYDAYTFSLISWTLLSLALLNVSIFRFADEQSIYIAMFSVASVSMIQTYSIPLIIAYWFGAFTWPSNIGADSRKGSTAWPQGLEPFYIKDILDKTEIFFSDLPKHSKVLCAFKDPKNIYEKIFDGYRTIYEIAFHAGNLKQILVFPDWWAIFENNSIDSPEFWGREPEDVIANIKLWDADHVLIYQETESSLEPKWLQNGFTELAQLDWTPLLKNELKGESCWGNHLTPKWFLLQCPKIV
jgi:hypothetical protein